MTDNQPRTAPIPSTFWAKHNSERTQARFNTLGGANGEPSCTVCGADLNPEKAFTVCITDGGSTFINPADVTDEILNSGDFMGCWDLGSSCVRFAPARVRAPFVSFIAEEV